MKPRIFIGVPCYGMVAPEVLDDWMRWCFYLGRRLPQFDFFCGVRTKSEQFRARNAIVEGAMSVGADWLLMMDDDMIVNPQIKVAVADEYAFIDRLLAHDKDIVGALYFQRTGGGAPVAMKRAGERGYRFLRDDELTGGLQEVDVTGGGAMLVRMKIFDRLPHPFFAPEHEFGTDVQLCRAAQAQGIKVYLDSGVELGHVRDERVIITSRNKSQYAMSDALPGDVKAGMNFNDVFNRLVADGLEYTGYSGPDELAEHGQRFMSKANMTKLGAANLADWYREYPKQRVARQIWYNTANKNKRSMDEFILGTINDSMKVDILDFGCGVGVTALELALRGHNVTAADIDGTGTIEFLKWRANKYNAHLTYHLTNGGIPHLGSNQYAAVIVMDCLEHIPEWRLVLGELAAHLKPGGVLFCNNGVLDDDTHPEHFPLDNAEFYAECVKNGLMPFNQIAFMKREAKASAA